MISIRKQFLLRVWCKNSFVSSWKNPSLYCYSLPSPAWVKFREQITAYFILSIYTDHIITHYSALIMFMLDAQTHNSLKCYENVKCNLITFPFVYLWKPYWYYNYCFFSLAAMDPKNQSKLGNPSQYDDKYGLCW